MALFLKDDMQIMWIKVIDLNDTSEGKLTIRRNNKVHS